MRVGGKPDMSGAIIHKAIWILVSAKYMTDITGLLWQVHKCLEKRLVPNCQKVHWQKITQKMKMKIKYYRGKKSISLWFYMKGVCTRKITINHPRCYIEFISLQVPKIAFLCIFTSFLLLEIKIRTMLDNNLPSATLLGQLFGFVFKSKEWSF